MKEKVLTSTGFYGTGSSAVTDLLREYDNICCKSDNEIRFLHDPDGISDLEYNIIENPNRHNSSHSIKRFMKQMRMLDHVGPIKRYNKYFNNSFWPAIEEFCRSIVTCEYASAWHYDVYDRGNFFYILSRVYANINAIMHKLFKIPLDGRALVPKNELAMIPIVDEKDFLKAVNVLTGRIVHSLNAPKREYVMLDQFVPPSNIDRYARYVDGIKAVVVDRDPRDIYLLEKVVWNGTIAPTESVVKYCEWYKWTRDIYYKKPQSDVALNIRFEDLIYKYDETVRKIEAFFGLSTENHTKPRIYFDPNISIKNTQLWNLYTSYSEDIEYIEEHLGEYCYCFPENHSVVRSKNDVLF